ncbi:MAG: hypothetical protein LBM23_08840 [Propionibacteriaceae bacterium]|jgi:hypothetical protein|nr:hypothetical protein [Propionibacteriaceae bacterium]
MAEETTPTPLESVEHYGETGPPPTPQADDATSAPLPADEIADDAPALDPDNLEDPETALDDEIEEALDGAYTVVGEWLSYLFISFVGAAAIVLMEGLLASPVDPDGGYLAHVWATMRIGSDNPWEITGILLALFMVPVTLFLSVVLSDSGATLWAEKARDLALTLLWASSLVVAGLAWLCLPRLMSDGFYLLGLVLVAGSVAGCAALACFSRSRQKVETLYEQRLQRIITLDTAEQRLREHTSLADWLTDDSSGRLRLTRTGWWRLAAIWAFLILGFCLLILVYTAFASLIAPDRRFTVVLSIGSVTVASLLAIYFSQLRVVNYDVATAWERIGIVAVEIITVVVIATVAIVTVVTSGVTLAWWPDLVLAVFTVAIPLATGALWNRLGLHLFIYHRWREVRSQIMNLTKQNERDEQFLAMQRQASAARGGG